MEVYEPQQTFVYENKGNSAVIWRCFSRDIRAEIPTQLDGLSVDRIAPYAFSAHMEKDQIRNGFLQGKMKLYVPPVFRGSLKSDQPLEMLEELRLPELCGNQLEEIALPESMRHVGRYCFYNCNQLRRIEYYGTLEDWGSGVFTGVHHVHELRVYMEEDQRSWIQKVLDELPEEKQVEFFVNGAMLAKVTFPEFYEEGIENTPARILETKIHGTGFMYRNCFKNRKYDFAQYDALFYHAVVLESEEIVAQLVKNRLQYPYELTEKAREQYEGYIREHVFSMADQLLQTQNPEDIRWLFQIVSKESNFEELLTYLTDQAAKKQYAEIMSYLMDYRRVNSALQQRKRKRLSL